MPILHRRRRLAVRALFALVGLLPVALSFAGPAGQHATGQVPGTPGATVTVPGSINLSGHGSAVFTGGAPGSVTPPTAFTTLVTDFSDRAGTVTAQNSEHGVDFMIAADPGSTVVALARSCYAAGAADNTVSCRNISPQSPGGMAQLDFTVVSPLDPPLASVSLAAGEVATLLRLNPSGRGRPVPTPSSGPAGYMPPVFSPVPVLGVRRVAARVTLETPQAARVEWSDQGVTIMAPAGFLPVCTPRPDPCSPVAGQPGTVQLGTFSSGDLVEFSIEDHPLPGPQQALPAPGSAELPPGGTAGFVYPLPPGASGNHMVVVTVNAGDHYASAAADARALTLTAPPGFVVAPDAECTVSASQPNVTVCAILPRPVTFLLADTRAAAPLPQETALAIGGKTTLVAQDDAGNTRGIGVEYPGTASVSDSLPAQSIDLEWDGDTLTMTAPDGFALSGGGPGVTCEPLDDKPVALACPAPGTPARLYRFSTRNLTPGPVLHATPPFPPRAEISSPTDEGRTIQHVGQPVTFAARSGGGGLAVVWDFGDETLAAGGTVTHSYAAPGIYTATVIPFYAAFGSVFASGITEQQVIVPVDVPPVQVTYLAGWNLVGGPRGTLFVGALGPLYHLPWQPRCAALGPSATPAPINTPSQGTVFTLPPGCSDAYATLSAAAAVGPFPGNGTAAAAGQGYWAYFPRPTTVTLPFRRDAVYSSILPGGRYMMVANPGFRSVTVQGADAVYIYDPTAQKYTQATTLQPGQGGWAYAALTSEISFAEQGR